MVGTFVTYDIDVRETNINDKKRYVEIDLTPHHILAAPIDTLLADFSAGSLPYAMHALVGAHLEICVQNRRFVEELEAAKGRSVIEAAPAAIANRAVNLAAIFEGEPVETAAVSRCAVLPASLQALAGGNYDSLKWKAILPGFWHSQVWSIEGAEANFYRIKAGRKIPVHTHEGSEVTLVLRGAFHDDLGVYRRGDIAFADADVNHQPVAELGEDCICFAVTDAPLHLTGLLGRMVDRLFGHRH